MNKWKWRHFVLIWLAAFLLAPSLAIHNFFALNSRPPGSPPVSVPLFEPFGAYHFLGAMFEQMRQGDFGDSIVVFFVRVVPFLIFTFILSMVLYSIVRIVRYLWLSGETNSG